MLCHRRYRHHRGSKTTCGEYQLNVRFGPCSGRQPLRHAVPGTFGREVLPSTTADWLQSGRRPSECIARPVFEIDDVEQILHVAVASLRVPPVLIAASGQNRRHGFSSHAVAVPPPGDSAVFRRSVDRPGAACKSSLGGRPDGDDARFSAQDGRRPGIPGQVTAMFRQATLKLGSDKYFTTYNFKLGTKRIK